MRAALALLALAAAAAAGERGIAEILADHERALGGVAKVETLRSVATLAGTRHKVEGVETRWRLPDAWLRTIPNPAPGGSARVESFLGGMALASAVDTQRWRPNQLTTRGAYYAMKALAEPFPLRPYFGNAAAQQGLKIAFAEGYEVLTGPADAHGVRAVYLLDAKTHLLSAIRFEEEPNDPFTQVTFDQYRPVEGVSLPYAAFVRYRVYLQDPEEGRRLAAQNVSHWEQIQRWEVNPELANVKFAAPAPLPGNAKGFVREVHATGPSPLEAATGDFDGDGGVDVAVACEGALYVHFAGAMDAPKRVPLGKGQLRGLAVEDLDLDGRPEIITSCAVQPAERYLLVTFDEKRHYETDVIYGAPHFAREIHAVDLDRDGIGDLVGCGFSSQSLEIKFGNGAKAVRVVASRWPLATKANPHRRGLGLDVGDLDGDGMLDIAVADGERVVLFFGEANLAFQPRGELETPRPVGVRFADLDRDGRLDVLVANYHPLRELSRDVTVFLNRDGGLEPQEPVDGGRGLQCIAVGEFDGDGHPDVAAASSRSGQLWVLPGRGDGTFGKPRKYASGLGIVHVSVADVDGDHRDDVLAVNRLGDSIAIFRNARDFPAAPRAAPPRARVVPRSMGDVEYRMEGLSDPYEFVGEFRLPADIEDPSGITALGGLNTQLLLVSDKRSALFRATVDRSRNRLLVGPAVPLRGLEQERLDLEAADFDPQSGNVFLACEADSTILRATIFGAVLRRAGTDVPAGGNDGVEAIALRRRKDGTPLLYVFKERLGLTGLQPPVFAYALQEDPFALEKRLGPVPLPHPLADQAGAAVFGERLFVVSRLERAVVELGFRGDGFAGKEDVRTGSFRELEERLGLAYEKPPFYGMAEGIAVDQWGDLFLLFDNNRQTIGVAGKNRGTEGRLLWFRNAGGPKRAVRSHRVAAWHILVPKEREDAAAAAAELHRRALAGEDFELLVEEAGGTLYRVVEEPLSPAFGERRRSQLPVALGRLLFALDVGEVGFCERHAEESPDGWHIVKRVE